MKMTVAAIAMALAATTVSADNSLMASVEQDCRLQLQRDNPNQLVWDADDVGVYEVKNSVAEVWINYNRKANGRIFKNVVKICDVRVPSGTKVVNGSLVR